MMAVGSALRSRATRWAVGMALLSSGAAYAGPPFLTDDPEPTDLGHWEIYAPFADAAGKGNELDGSFGAELNYGALPGVQATVGIPLSYTHDATGWRGGRGDLDLSLKYRFFHDEAAGVSIAIFPGISLPTASHGLGSGHMTAFLPVWAQKDAGPWSLFGGGGYAINPGTGNRDFWTGGLALSRTVSPQLLVGVEADRQGPDTIGGRAATSLGLGAILNIRRPLRLLASGGPTFSDGGSSAGFHGFAALGIDF